MFKPPPLYNVWTIDGLLLMIERERERERGSFSLSLSLSLILRISLSTGLISRCMLLSCSQKGMKAETITMPPKTTPRKTFPPKTIPPTSLEDDDEGDPEIVILFSSDAEIHDVFGEPAMAGITT